MSNHLGFVSCFASAGCDGYKLCSLMDGLSEGVKEIISKYPVFEAIERGKVNDLVFGSQ